MKKFCFLFLSIFLCAGFAYGASRAQSTIAKNKNISLRQQNDSKNATVSRATANRTKADQNNISTKKTVSRTSAKKSIAPRTTTRTNVTGSGATLRRISRASLLNPTTKYEFDENYNSCRDAYFTCMDQFCATQNETYRRCVCSSRLSQIQKQEKTLAQTADDLQDFQAFNIEAISKTSDEVKSMVSVSAGEKEIKKDKSSSSKTLSSISSILEKSKKNSLSTQGTLDIAGNIKNIWTTTDFIANTDIANLTGEPLYNAVHAQCANAVSEQCNSSDLKMITSTYGMYIENDCSLIADSIDNRINAANTAIRTTRHQMQDARLENYDMHNSLSVNDCITHVKQDITVSTACGDNYIHCLDFSGKYLNLNTGEPIYSSDFYQLENQLSLSGDILTNETNVKFVNMLDKKRVFAEQSLNLCTDNADEVWDEFLRQAVIEIYQKQHQRVQDVKTECLQVVNECYLQKSDMLKDFSDTSSLILLGHKLELSEDLCADKLNTCSNLYGGGPEGLSVLVNTIHNITNETIAQTCSELLTTFVENICAVSVNDSYHSYPYACRVYAPGEAIYAHNAICNSTLVNPFSKSDILPATPTSEDNSYICTIGNKRYTRCNFNYYLYNADATAASCQNGDAEYDANVKYCKNNATECRVCPTGYVCTGGNKAPENIDTNIYNSCGPYYIGSLYQQLVRFALQNCTRPSDDSYVLSESLLADVNTVMQSLKIKLSAELSSECEKHDGTWVDTPWIDENSDGYHDITKDTLLQEFYIETGTNTLWGYCK